jgi:hypothetical protein
MANVIVTEECVAAPVPAPPPQSIQLTAALYRNGVLVAESGYKTFPEVYIAKTNAAAPCISGTYQGWMGAYIVSTPGWVPPIQIQSGYGPAMYVTC